VFSTGNAHICTCCILCLRRNLLASSAFDLSSSAFFAIVSLSLATPTFFIHRFSSIRQLVSSVFRGFP
jgi:hypothetical protein